jgi:hypothetical protein
MFDTGKVLVAPAVLFGASFLLYFLFGPGRGQISSLIETVSFFFGSSQRAIFVGIALFSGAVGGGLMLGADHFGSGCPL